MKKLICIIVGLTFSCNNATKNNTQAHTKAQTTNLEQSKPKVNTIEEEEENQSADSIFKTKANIISVSKTLIMPDDYLTTAMTVKTDDNKTLVFLDMDGF